MPIAIDIDFNILLDFIDRIFIQGPLIAIWQLFLKGGWIFVLILFLSLAKFLWLNWRVSKYKSKWAFVVLAIDIPRNNEQSTKAVENVFVALAGTRSGGDFIDKWWIGKVQESFSWEICSLEGYIQFFVRTPAHFRDVIEASIFAQYPDANIREVPDYTENAPDVFPNEEYDMWGSDIVLDKSIAFPLRTYPFFEDSLSQELKDPMASFLESLSRLGPGEYFWMQMILIPTDDKWKTEGEKEVNKFAGKKSPPKYTWLNAILSFPIQLLVYAGDTIFGREAALPKRPDAPQGNPMLLLTPGQRLTLEAIEHKMSKIGYKTKIRIVYLARKEVYNGPRGVAGPLGGLQQFTDLGLNGLKPHATYRTIKKRLFKKYQLADKQTKLMQSYKRRNPLGGGQPYVLNTEEIASVYHFPVMGVKAPAVKKSEAKRAEAPFLLPTGAGPEVIFQMAEKTAAKKKVENRGEKQKRFDPEDENLVIVSNTPEKKTKTPKSQPAHISEPDIDIDTRDMNGEPPPNLPTGLSHLP